MILNHVPNVKREKVLIGQVVISGKIHLDIQPVKHARQSFIKEEKE